MAPILSSAELTLVQPEHVSRHVVQPRPLSQLRLDVRAHRLNDRLTVGTDSRWGVEQSGIDVAQEPWILVRCPTHHHAIDLLKVLLTRFQRFDAAIDHNSERGEVALELMLARLRSKLCAGLKI